MRRFELEKKYIPHTQSSWKSLLVFRPVRKDFIRKLASFVIFMCKINILYAALLFGEYIEHVFYLKTKTMSKKLLWVLWQTYSHI